ncbi:MAG: hypothetical protein WC827_00395 [Candidatus Paceibacterota bacterium]|jgi:hypothetical protein
MNSQKGFVIPIIIAIVAIFAIGGGIFYIKTSKSNFPCWPPLCFPGRSAPTIDETKDWKTYTNTWGGFEVKYPSDWKIIDKSNINNTSNAVTVSITVESPLRYNFPGYQSIGVSYRVLIYMPDGRIESIADFGSNQPAQSWWNLDVSKATKEASPEYLVGQNIISSFKFMNNIVGGDKDIHGCTGSAGYSWCEVKNKCLRVWEEKCEATLIQPSITVLSPNGGEVIPYSQIIMAGDLMFRWTTSEGNKYFPSATSSINGVYSSLPNFKVYIIDTNDSIVREDNRYYIDNLGEGVFVSSFPGDNDIKTNTKYKIKICDFIGGKNICDSSDNYFLIK